MVSARASLTREAEGAGGQPVLMARIRMPARCTQGLVWLSQGASATQQEGNGALACTRLDAGEKAAKVGAVLEIHFGNLKRHPQVTHVTY